MVFVERRLPVDNSFLSEVLYEGLLYTLSKSKFNFTDNKICVGSDAFIKTFEKLDKIVNISTSGKNDSVKKLLDEWHVSFEEKPTNFSDIFVLLKQNYQILSIQRNNILLALDIRDGKALVDEGSDKITFQIFKIDRYKGLTSFETGLSDKQITLYFSKESALIALLGLYSSYITRSRDGYYFFIFFAPEELESLLSSNEGDIISKYFIIKDTVSKELEEILHRTTLNEVILLDILLSIEINSLLLNENLDKLSITIFKIAKEGQTYKVYELLPITIYKNIPFMRSIEKCYKNKERVLEILHKKVLNPHGPILTNLSKNDSLEYSNLLEAIQSLYRFITVGDARWLFIFLRELENAYQKSKNEEYLSIIRNLY